MNLSVSNLQYLTRLLMLNLFSLFRQVLCQH